MGASTRITRDDSPPERFGPFEVVGRLGDGGMGVVLRARDPSGWEVAVKVLAAHGSRLDRVRFEREIDLIRGLQHENVVRIVDAGREGGWPWLAMELLEGEDLAACLRRGALEPAEAVRIGVEAGRGLAAAHAAGIVHRDVKPANVFLGRDGRVKLLDFGIAVPWTNDERRVTEAGVVVGTPDYMAPEQVEGRRQADPRTDVWGLGATLYHALAGRPPFRSNHRLGQLFRIVHEPADALPAGIPIGLAAALQRALSKDPDDRFPGVEVMLDALRRGLESTDVDAATLAGPTEGVTLEEDVRIVSVLVGIAVAAPETFEDVARRHGGRAMRLGDGGALAVFGAGDGVPARGSERAGDGVPARGFHAAVRDGDEAEAALSAALEIRALDEAERPARRGGPRLGLGVATGRAVRDVAGDVTGEVLAVAESMIRYDGVGIDRTSLPHLRGRFAIELTLEGAGIVRGRREGVRVDERPMRGRDAEMALLEAAFARALAEGHPEGVVVEGPAGIGKSLLLAAFEANVLARHEHVLRLELAGDRHRRLVGWRAWTRAIRRWAELPEGTPPALVRERLLQALPVREHAEVLGEILGAPFGATKALEAARRDPTLMRDRIADAIGALVEGLATRGPVAILVDDVQWLDEPSLAALELLPGRLEGHAVFVVALERREEPGAEGRLPGLRRVGLPPLSRGDVDAIVTDVLGGACPPGEWTSAIRERAGGNPFFAEELARAWMEGLSEPPASVEATIQARLDRLEARERDLLRRAAVLGGSFSVEGLESLGQPDARALLARLQRRDLCRPAGGDRWAFRHALVREVAYRTLTDTQRMRLHGAAARWLGTRADAPPFAVAQHLDLAGETERAGAEWARAADRALVEGDPELALAASAKVLETTVDRAFALRLRLRRAELLHVLGRRAAFGEEIEAARALAESADERAAVAALEVQHVRLCGRYAEAAALGARVLAETPDHVAVLIDTAMAAAEMGGAQDALPRLRDAVRLAARAKDGRLEGRAQFFLALCHSMLGEPGEALPLFEQALARAVELRDKRRAAATRGALACLELAMGRADRAVARLEEAAEECRASGNRTHEGYTLHNLGLARARQGRFEEALEVEARALRMAIELGHPRLRLGCLKYQALILVELGRPEDALDALAEADRVPAAAHGNLVPQLGAIRAAALLASGRLELARAEAERAIAVRDRLGGMEEHELELFLTAHEAGVPGALRRGVALLFAKARRLRDRALRGSFLREVPAHRALLDAWDERPRARRRRAA